MNSKEDPYAQYAVSDPYSHYAASRPEKKGTHPWYSRYARDLAAGILEGGRGLANTPHKVAELFGFGDRVANLADPNFDYAKFVGAPDDPSVADTLLQGAGQFAPALAAPEMQLGRVGELLGSAPKVGRYLKSIAGNALPQALYGATQTENPLEGAKTAAEYSAPFSVLQTAIGSQNPLVKLLGRGLLSATGAGTGYLGAKALGLPLTAQAGATATGALLGFAGKNPQKEALEKIAEGVEGTNYTQKLAAAKRLKLGYLTPAEASGNPFLAAVQGKTGKSEGGAKLLYEKGMKRLGQEKSAINRMLDTIHTEKLDPEVSNLYQSAYPKMVPYNHLAPLFENEVFKRAQRIVENKPAYKESLKGVAANSIGYLDHINKALYDMAEKAPSKEARIINDARHQLTGVTDKISPEYQQARQLAERQITRRKLEESVNEDELRGTNFFRSALKNDKKFDKLMHSLRNVPEAQRQLQDMRLVFKDLINPPTVRTSAGFTKAGMDQARNTKKAYADMFKDLFKGKKGDEAMVELITNPKWSQEIKEINQLSSYKKKLMKTSQLMGKVASSIAVSKKNKPLELEVTQYNVQK